MQTLCNVSGHDRVTAPPYERSGSGFEGPAGNGSGGPAVEVLRAAGAAVAQSQLGTTVRAQVLQVPPGRHP